MYGYVVVYVKRELGDGQGWRKRGEGRGLLVNNFTGYRH